MITLSKAYALSSRDTKYFGGGGGGWRGGSNEATYESCLLLGQCRPTQYFDGVEALPSLEHPQLARGAGLELKACATSQVLALSQCSRLGSYFAFGRSPGRIPPVSFPCISYTSFALSEATSFWLRLQKSSVSIHSFLFGVVPYVLSCLFVLRICKGMFD